MSYEVQSSPFIHHFRLPSADVYITTPLTPTLHEGAQTVSFTIPAGTYVGATFISGLEAKLNLISPHNYTYTVLNEGEACLMTQGGIRGFQVGVTSTGNFSIS